MSKLICLDFDGVIHSYTSPWVNETTIPDPPVPGALDFIRALFNAKMRVAIHSTRNTVANQAMREWLLKHGLEPTYANRIEFPIAKPVMASLFIDDRAFAFTGTFPSTEYCKNFKPWNKQV